MITAVDTNVLLDVLLDDPIFEKPSESALQQATKAGSVVICEVVYAELAGVFDLQTDLEAFLSELGVRLRASDTSTLWKAGQLWAEFCRKQHHKLIGRRLLADFLIGAHALLQADRLLTRDRDFYRTAFAGLRLV